MLKAHEIKINEIAVKGKMNLGGPLALMSMVSAKDSKIEVVEQVNFEDARFLMNFEDEAVTYYSNNKVKNFLKNPFNSMYNRNNEFWGNTSSGKGTRVESKEVKKDSKTIVEKAERKLKGRFQV